MAQLTIKKKLKIVLGTFVLKIVVRLLWATCRVQPVIGEEHLQHILTNKTAFIPCFWHELLIFGAYYMRRLQKRGANVGFLVSPSSDGELGSQLLNSWGIQVIRGSATRTGAQAMQALYTVIKKDGVCPVNNPDGPRGPAREFKVGTVLLAQLTGAPLVPLAYAAEKAWRLRSWDKFVIPKPFSRINIVVGRPMYVDKKLSKDEQEAVRYAAQTALNETLRTAESRFNNLQLSNAQNERPLDGKNNNCDDTTR